MSSADSFARYQELQRYVGWTDEDARLVASLAPRLSPYFPSLIDDFYEEISRHEATRKVITGGEEQIARLKRTLQNWLAELFSGVYDAKYVERRLRVGLRHVEIGLDQVYTNVALSRLRRGLLAILIDDDASNPRVFEARRALNILLDLDLAIIEDAYQAEYQRRQQQVERLAAIGQVAGGIAHELRNPLNVVKTSVYFLLNAKNPPAEKVAAHLERIDRQVGLADGVITALHNFARLPVPEMQPLAVGELLKQALELATKPAAVVQVIDCNDEGPRVLGDPRQLGIVLGNLIRNAYDAMSEGGTLRLRTVSHPGQVAIEVSDTGRGIAPEDLARVAEPLFSTKARGLGLGLAITRAIVEKHLGRLELKSTLGQGTTVTVWLPTDEHR